MRRRSPAPVRRSIARQWRGGVVLLAASGMVLMLAIKAHAAIGITIALLLGAWLLLVHGLRRIRGAGSRRHGIDLENREAGRLEKRLRSKGWSVTRNVSVRGLGDIDMQAARRTRTWWFTPSRSRRWIVEIKSFRLWLDPPGPREQKTIHQVIAQMAASGIPDAVIWLPDAQGPNLLVHDHVFLVRGDDTRVCSILSGD